MRRSCSGYDWLTPSPGRESPEGEHTLHTTFPHALQLWATYSAHSIMIMIISIINQPMSTAAMHQ